MLMVWLSPSRRWLRYSLRSLLVLMLLAAVGMTVYRHYLKRQWVREALIEDVRSFGGGATVQAWRSEDETAWGEDSALAITDHLVEVDLFGHGWRRIAQSAPVEDLDARLNREAMTDMMGGWAPSLERRQRADDCLGRIAELGEVRRLSLQDSDGALTNEHLAHLAGCAELEQLDLSNNPLTDGAMPHLAGLTGLKRLNLAHTYITDEGLKHLAGLKQLEFLDLSLTKITSAGLATIRRLPNLRHLYLHTTGVAGDVDLRGLRRLEHVVISNCEITSLRFDQGVPLRSLDLDHNAAGDEALATLARLKHLEQLDLCHNGFTADGLAQLVGLSKLRRLRCDAAVLRGAGIQHLKQLPALKDLHVRQIDMRADIRQTLKTDLPQVRSRIIPVLVY